MPRTMLISQYLAAPTQSASIRTNVNEMMTRFDALLLNRLSQQIATRFLRDMEHSPTTLIWVTPRDVHRAKAIIYQYTDKDFSLTDAASFTVMERLRIPAAFTFDRHFAQYSFTVLSAQ